MSPGQAGKHQTQRLEESVNCSSHIHLQVVNNCWVSGVCGTQAEMWLALRRLQAWPHSGTHQGLLLLLGEQEDFSWHGS